MAAGPPIVGAARHPTHERMNPDRESTRGIVAKLLHRLLPPNLGVLAGANLVSQVASFLAMPLLTRWCTVADFGFYQIFATCVTVLGLLACARFDQAIMVPVEDAAGRGLCLLGATAAIATGIVVIGLIAVLGPWHGSTWSVVSDWGTLLGAAVTITGASAAITQWHIRLGRFNLIVRARVAQSIGTIAIQVGGAAAGLGSTALICGDATGRLAGLIALTGIAPLAAQMRALPDYHKLLGLARTHLRFPLISTPSALINAAGFSLPVIMLERFYGAQAVGVFSLLERVMGIPTVLIGQPLSQLFSHSYRSSLARGGAAAVATIRKAVGSAALLGGVPFVVLLCAGAPLFNWVFGPQWEATGRLAQVLALPYFISYLLWPTMPALIIVNRLRPQLIWDIARAGAMLAVLILIGTSGRESNVAISAVVMLMATMYVVHFIVTVRATKRHEA